MPLVLIAMTLVYFRGWHQLRKTRAALLSAWRPTAFVSGITLWWVSTASRLGALNHQLLTAHMVKHLLLMTVAAPLILLGEPFIVFVGPVSRVLSAIRFTGNFGRMMSRPVVCWFASTAVVIGWHIPSLFELAMRSVLWHELEQMSFLVGGLLFWWPVIRPWPSAESGLGWCIPLYLFLATLPCDALSAFLVFCNRVVYSHYQFPSSRFQFSPLGDQEWAGALMWIWVTFAYLAPAAGIAMHLLSPQKDDIRTAGQWRSLPSGRSRSA